MNALEMDNEERLGVSASELRSAKVDVACQLVNDLATGIIEDHPDLEPVDQYRLIAESLPGRVDEDLQRKLLKKAQKKNDRQASLTFLMLNLRSVFSVAEPYINGDPERDDELVCSGLQELVARLPNIKVNEQLKPQVHAAAREGIVTFLEQSEGVNPGLTRSGVVGEVQDAADQVLKQHPWGTGKERLKKVARQLVKGEKYPNNAPGSRTVLDYLMKRIEEDSVVLEENEEVEREEDRNFREEELNRLMADDLLEREQQVLDMRYYQDMTPEGVGEKLGFTTEQIREIEARALRKLRHPSRSKWLR